ncbi:MAG: cytidylate kinase-like family protein [Candidatus Mcinerneyibacterium aminivorans]|uniref:Cytidylate kinase-like family protein n=1 Tax=Candidatus Mcinerneyibacterium aminivorans TaxID=2703815 RepID=A0A5D0MD04_9BACT|nr:MAG: cytidylate kinase-like family protein [Candidatus Mcinerneyibacterium aminivorans]
MRSIIRENKGGLMNVITVSREYGLFVEDLLKDFARDNDMNIFSHQLLMEVAKKIDEPIEKLENLYSMEKFKSFKIFLTEMLQSMTEASSLFVESSQMDSPIFFPLFYPTSSKKDDLEKIENRESYIDLMRKVIIDTYKKGNVIIIGRGAQIVLRDYKKVRHLRFVGSCEKQIERVMDKLDLEKEEAINKIKTINKRRKDYISYFYDEDINDNSLYHFIVNVDRLGKDNLYGFLKHLAGGRNG